MIIEIEIVGRPVPWKAHAGFGRKSFNPRFKEKEYYQWKIKQQYKGEALQGPIYLYCEYFFPIPKSTSKVRRAAMLKGDMHHITRPDCSNCTKFVEDCLKGIVFEDDSQVVIIIAVKKYSVLPRTYVTISKTPLHQIPEIGISKDKTSS